MSNLKFGVVVHDDRDHANIGDKSVIGKSSALEMSRFFEKED